MEYTEINERGRQLEEALKKYTGPYIPWTCDPWTVRDMIEKLDKRISKLEAEVMGLMQKELERRRANEESLPAHRYVR